METLSPSQCIGIRVHVDLLTCSCTYASAVVRVVDGVDCLEYLHPLGTFFVEPMLKEPPIFQDFNFLCVCLCTHSGFVFCLPKSE